MDRLPARGLYAITADEADDDKFLRDVALCLKSGAAILQYRDKLRGPARQLDIAIRLRDLCSRFRVPLVINDSVALAHACGADGVHLGTQEIHALPGAKSPSRKLVVGISCYDSLERAREALAAGADYLAFGSVFVSSTKPGATRCDLDVLRAARAEFTAPIVAIGGLTPENGRAALEAGADFLAVISGIFGQADIAAAVQRYRRLFS